MSNPVLVNTLRGEVVENRHRGAIAVCDPRGRILHARGDVGALVYPRSSIKPLQALPLVETGAADHFQVSEAELALACSSHGGETEHTEAVNNWLQRLDLDEASLECGPHPPMHDSSAADMIARKTAPGRVHNNCSGKHTGMLTAVRYLDEDAGGYIEREHPAQQRWFDALGQMAGVDMRELPWNRDGCGIPVIAMPLTAIATAFARFAVPDDLPPARTDAIARITAAIAAHPFMVAGTGRLCTEIMQLTGRRVLVKAGADGTYTAALPEKGLGLALKIDDGTGEAAQVALLAALQWLQVLDHDEIAALADRHRMPITNSLGVITGYREASDAWQ